MGPSHSWPRRTHTAKSRFLTLQPFCYINQIMRRASASLALASLFALGPLAAGAGEKKFSLTIDNIMRGPNLVGYEPAQIRWSGDNSKIYFQWKKASEPVAAPLDSYVVNRN